MNILERIKSLCASKGIGINELESLLGFSKSSMYRWNDSVPGADKLSKVADYFNVSTDYLLGKEKSKDEIITTPTNRYLDVPLEPETLKIMCRIPLLNKTNQAIISDMIESMIKNQG